MNKSLNEKRKYVGKGFAPGPTVQHIAGHGCQKKKRIYCAALQRYGIRETVIETLVYIR